VRERGRERQREAKRERNTTRENEIERCTTSSYWSTEE
tara:strand:+ start:155 stop:268 length:114 start_codon:yes stop_codon:yes gene_type:complete